MQDFGKLISLKKAKFWIQDFFEAKILKSAKYEI